MADWTEVAVVTGRERLHRILNRQPVDRLSWTTLVDSTSLSVMPEPERSMAPLDFYCRIGCDVLQFGNYGLPADCQVQSPARRVGPAVEVAQDHAADGTWTVRTRTPWGTLTAASQGGHPVKYAVETLADLRVLKNVYLNTRYEEVQGTDESFRRAETQIGDAGMFVPTLGPSPVQQLIELDMGLATFYYLLEDARTEVEELLAIMHEGRRQEYEIVARCTPATAVIPVENTSSTLTSPAIYERYSLPQIRDYVDVMHRHGKQVILHMCGLLRNLLPVIRRTGADGYNATTPPTVGDTPLEWMLDTLGQDVVLFGGIFSPNDFQRPGVTKAELWRALDRLYTPRLRRANLVLWLGADGLPTPLERFLAVGEWMEKNGAL